MSKQKSSAPFRYVIKEVPTLALVLQYNTRKWLLWPWFPSSCRKTDKGGNHPVERQVVWVSQTDMNPGENMRQYTCTTDILTTPYTLVQIAPALSVAAAAPARVTFGTVLLSDTRGVGLLMRHQVVLHLMLKWMWFVFSSLSLSWVHFRN